MTVLTPKRSTAWKKMDKIIPLSQPLGQQDLSRWNPNHFTTLSTFYFELITLTRYTDILKNFEDSNQGARFLSCFFSFLFEILSFVEKPHPRSQPMQLPGCDPPTISLASSCTQPQRQPRNDFFAEGNWWR